MRLKNFINFCLTGAWLGLCGQMITGRIIDQDKKPLEMLEVCNMATSECVYSDSLGIFIIKAGIRDTLWINNDEYTNNTWTVVNNKNFLWEVNDKIVQLSDVVITSRLDPLIKIRESGYEVQVTETEKYNNRNTDINKIMEQTSGINIRQDGGLGAKTNYSINGLSGKAVSFFMDGIPLYYYGHTFSPSTLPVPWLHRIETYKGVVPTSLGSDATGGAVNLVTNKTINNGGNISYTLGSFNTHKFQADLSYAHKKTGLWANILISKQKSDNNYWVWDKNIFVTDPQTFEIKRGIKVRRFHDGFASQIIKVAWGVRGKLWADQLFISLMKSGLDKELQHGTTMQATYGQARYYQDLKMIAMQYEKANFLLKGLSAEAFVGYTNLVKQRIDTSVKIYNWLGQVEGYRTLGGEQSLSLLSSKLNNSMIRLHLIYKIGHKSEITVTNLNNYSIRHDNDPTITTKNIGYWTPQVFRKNYLGLSYTSKSVADKSRLEVFTKLHRQYTTAQIMESDGINMVYSSLSNSVQKTSFGLAFAQQIWKNLRWKISAELCNRLPDAEELLGDGITLSNNPLLAPETSKNLNTSVTFNNINIRNYKISASCAGSYRYIDNFIQRLQYTSGLFRYENVDRLKMFAYETQISISYFEIFKVSQYVSQLTPTVLTDRDQFGNVNILKGSRLANTPMLQYSIETDVNLNKLNFKCSRYLPTLYWRLIHVGAFYKYAENIGRYNKDQIPAQWSHDIGLGYCFYKESLCMNVDFPNIFNSLLYDNFDIQKPGRSMSIKISYKLNLQE